MKEILIIRHGELENPTGTVYNRDSVTKADDIIHISKKGEQQLHLLALEIKKQNKVPDILWSSPETRARESAEILLNELGLNHIEIMPDLDDVYAPGPYLERMTMKQFQANNVNNYDKTQWAKYKHETAKAVTERMLGLVKRIVIDLINDQVGAMISHGDPIAFLLNYLQTGKIPNPKNIRKMMYPPKGSATMLTYSDMGDFIKLAPFGSLILQSGSNY